MPREHTHFRTTKVEARPLSSIDPGYDKDELKPAKDEMPLREVQRVSGHTHQLTREEKDKSGLVPIVCIKCGYGKLFTESEADTLDLSKGEL